MGGWLDFLVIIPPQPSQAEARMGFCWAELGKRLIALIDRQCTAEISDLGDSDGTGIVNLNMLQLLDLKSTKELPSLIQTITFKLSLFILETT